VKSRCQNDHRKMRRSKVGSHIDRLLTIDLYEICTAMEESKEMKVRKERLSHGDRCFTQK